MPQPFILSPKPERSDLCIVAPRDYEREDFADAYDWLNRRKPGVLSDFADELRGNFDLVLIVAAAGFVAGVFLTLGLAYIIAWAAF